MSEIIHYMDPMSRALRTEHLLHAFEIPHRDVKIDIRKGDQKTDEYAKVHPLQCVPALQNGDITLMESGAITLYLADLFPEKMNTPAVGTPERARFYEWIFFLQTTLEPVAMGAFDPAKKDESKVKIRQMLEKMAAKFVGPFVLGAQFSVADVVLHTEMGWYKMMDAFPTGLEPYEGFMKRMDERLAAKAGQAS